VDFVEQFLWAEQFVKSRKTAQLFKKSFPEESGSPSSKCRAVAKFVLDTLGFFYIRSLEVLVGSTVPMHYPANVTVSC